VRARLVEIGREAAFAVALQPIVVGKALAQLRDRLADALLLGREGEVQGSAAGPDQVPDGGIQL